MTVSERLIAWRKAANLSRRKAAELSGVCQPTFYDLEAGTAKRVSVDTALAIERLTGGAIRVTEWAGLGADDSASTGERAAVSTKRTGT